MERCHNKVTGKRIDGGIYGKVILKWVKRSFYRAMNHGFVKTHKRRNMRETVHPRRIYHSSCDVSNPTSAADDAFNMTDRVPAAVLKLIRLAK